MIKSLLSSLAIFHLFSEYRDKLDSKSFFFVERSRQQEENMLDSVEIPNPAAETRRNWAEKHRGFKYGFDAKVEIEDYGRRKFKMVESVVCLIRGCRSKTTLFLTSKYLNRYGGKTLLI